MILREFLEKNVGKRVKIGAQRGSSFIFADEIKKNTIDIIQNLSDRQYEKITNNLTRLQDKDAELEAFAEEAERLAEWGEKFNVSRDMRDATKLYTAKYKGIARTTKDQLRRANSVVSIWEPYLDRQIMEKYKSYKEYQTMIVMVTGIETGAYWTIKEYRDNIKKGGNKNESAETYVKSDGDSGAEAED